MQLRLPQPKDPDFDQDFLLDKKRTARQSPLEEAGSGGADRQGDG